jgi:hypothetical protein
MMHISRRPEGSTSITEETANAATITKPRKRKKIELTPQEFWETEFLAHQTWRILCITVRGFIEYARCVLKTEREMNRTERKVWFVPVLHSNTTNLEGVFSVQRMRKCDNAQTYANGIARATANPKMAKTAARNSGQYEHNVEDQDTAPIIPELPSRDTGRKMKACEKQQTEWMARIDVIVVALSKTTSRALQDKISTIRVGIYTPGSNHVVKKENVHCRGPILGQGRDTRRINLKYSHVHKCL